MLTLLFKHLSNVPLLQAVVVLADSALADWLLIELSELLSVYNYTTTVNVITMIATTIVVTTRNGTVAEKPRITSQYSLNILLYQYKAIRVSVQNLLSAIFSS